MRTHTCQRSVYLAKRTFYTANGHVIDATRLKFVDSDFSLNWYYYHLLQAACREPPTNRTPSMSAERELARLLGSARTDGGEHIAPPFKLALEVETRWPSFAYAIGPLWVP